MNDLHQGKLTEIMAVVANMKKVAGGEKERAEGPSESSSPADDNSVHSHSDNGGPDSEYNLINLKQVGPSPALFHSTITKY